METIAGKLIAHILKYIVVQKQLQWGRGNVVIFFIYFFLLSVVIFYTSCFITAALKTDA